MNIYTHLRHITASVVHALKTILFRREYHRWFLALSVAFACETLLFSLFFFLQNAERINTPDQQNWLRNNGVASLQEFIWHIYIYWEGLRRLPWAIYGVGIVWYAERFPVMKETFVRKNIVLHLVTATVLCILHGFLHVWMMAIFYPSDGYSFYQYARSSTGMFLAYIHYTLLVTLVSMLNYHRQYRAVEVRSAQLETELAQAQLQALKMQLHPHFLFNALNSISALLYKDPRRADSMIARLGDFLRITLDNPTTQFIPLKQELDLLQCYVDIEMLRFPKRLHVEMQVESGLQDVEVPNLLLQPLVENSVKYGVMQSTHGGKITIVARRLPSDNHTLEITVRDNGPGIQLHDPTLNRPLTSTPGKLSKKSSIGLQNTRSRLEKLYGNRFRFDTYNAPEGGFVVYIEIPLQISNSSENQEQEHHSYTLEHQLQTAKHSRTS